jgi:ribosomal protein S6
LRTYELMCIVQPELDEEGMTALNARIAEVIAGSGGQVLTTEILGRRRLAFPIRKKTEGVYVLTYANMDSAGMAELQRRLRLTEEVIRYLIVRPDEDEIPLPSEGEEAEEGGLGAKDVDDEDYGDDDDDDDDAYGDDSDDDTDD